MKLKDAIWMVDKLQDISTDSLTNYQKACKTLFKAYIKKCQEHNTLKKKNILKV